MFHNMNIVNLMRYVSCWPNASLHVALTQKNLLTYDLMVPGIH